jgi:very-short-patch-repair endonuclease
MKTNPAIVIAYWRANGIPEPLTEYRFHPTRKFRADYCWPDKMVILECEGGVWIRGKHGRPSGIKSDMDRGNEIAKLGYRLLRFEPSAMMKQTTVDIILGTIKMNFTGANTAANTQASTSAENWTNQ